MIRIASMVFLTLIIASCGELSKCPNSKESLQEISFVWKDKQPDSKDFGRRVHKHFAELLKMDEDQFRKYLPTDGFLINEDSRKSSCNSIRASNGWEGISRDNFFTLNKRIISTGTKTKKLYSELLSFLKSAKYDRKSNDGESIKKSNNSEVFIIEDDNLTFEVSLEYYSDVCNYFISYSLDTSNY